MGNSSIRHMTAQEMCVGQPSLIHQGLSVHMPALGTLLSTKSVHTFSLAAMGSLQEGLSACPTPHCSKMTLGNFVVLDQGLSRACQALHTILSTKSVHKALGAPFETATTSFFPRERVPRRGERWINGSRSSQFLSLHVSEAGYCEFN